jgi:hypothetical protein
MFLNWCVSYQKILEYWEHIWIFPDGYRFIGISRGEVPDSGDSGRYDKISSMPDEQSPSPLDVPTRPTPRSDSSQASEAWLVILRGAQAGEEIPLRPGVNLFGREEGTRLLDNRVSRRHFQVQNIDGEYMVMDLHSTNGTFLNGTKISHPVLLQHGDMLRVGDMLISMKISGAGSQDPGGVGARTSEPKPSELGGTTILVSRMNLAKARSSSEAESLDDKPKPEDV